MRRLLIGAALGILLLASAAVARPGPTPQYLRKTSGPVLALAADGNRAAFIVEGRVKECMSVMVWEPTRRRIARVQSGAAACESTDRLNRRGLPAVALAGTRAVWLLLTGGNTLETILRTATLARPRWVWLAAGYANDGVYGTFASPPAGDGALVAFTIDERCDADAEINGHPKGQCPPGKTTGDIVAATIWRLGGRGRCPGVVAGKPFPCSPVAKADSELAVLAVDAGRIAARTDRGVKLFTARGRLVREFTVRPSAAKLSRNRLAVRTADAVEVYDVRNGSQLHRFPVPKAARLEDLDGDILVTASGGTVTLRRLNDGSTTAIAAGKTGLAQLERPGLFVASARRVTFISMRDVMRRLGD